VDPIADVRDRVVGAVPVGVEVVGEAGVGVAVVGSDNIGVAVDFADNMYPQEFMPPFANIVCSIHPMYLATSV
jgi:hypothetical protein